MLTQPINGYDLDAQLERTVEWLKFAEAKNAIALTFASGLLFGLLQQTAFSIKNVFSFIAIGILLLIISMLIYSFIPRLSWTIKTDNPPLNPNLHYFGHISALSLTDYQNLIISSYGGHDRNSKYFQDVTSQIKINSEIAMLKFKIFNLSCKIFFIALLLLIIAA